ncbi:MAG: hypothetical protein AAF993_03035 [Pseudomonadota bacterium]
MTRRWVRWCAWAGSSLKVLQVRLLLLVALLQSGCAIDPPRSTDALAEFVTVQTAQAQAFEAQGQLRTALIYWMTVEQLTGENENNTRRLQVQIEQLVEQYLEQASVAQSGQRRKEAFLKVLALSPGESVALDGLRELDTRRVVRLQSAKSAAENANRVRLQTGITETKLAEFQALLDAARYRAFVYQAGQLPEADKHPKFRQMKIQALLQFARQLQRSGQTEQALERLQQADLLAGGESSSVAEALQQLRQSLSEEWVMQGISLMNREPERAVDALQRAVGYDPANLVAQQQLARARKIVDNLNKLKALQAD